MDYNEIVNTLIDDIDKDKINSFVSELCNLLIDCAKTTFGTHKYKTRPDTCNKKPKGDKPWINYEWQESERPCICVLGVSSQENESHVYVC